MKKNDRTIWLTLGSLTTAMACGTTPPAVMGGAGAAVVAGDAGSTAGPSSAGASGVNSMTGGAGPTGAAAVTGTAGTNGTPTGAAAGATSMGGGGSAGSPGGDTGAGGTFGTGGASGQAGAATGSGGTSGAGGDEGSSGTGGASTGGAGAAGAPAGTDERPWFSFFVTSLPGLVAECGSEGCGGNFGGLSGADDICTRLARAGNPGDQKTWVAFLSTTGMYGDMLKVDAVDRVGDGPWWDWHGRMLAPDLASLVNDRPEGGDAALAVMFVDETGVDSKSARNGDGLEDPDNHDTLTGSAEDGRLAELGEDDGTTGTCQDWTSDTERGDGEVPVGHAWPRQEGSTSGSGSRWIQDHTVNGCEPGFNIGGGGGACDTCYAVGDGGGYGAFFCFALDAVAPEEAP